MKIIIIGSKGFIGSHCFQFFSSENDTWGCDIYTDYNEKKFFLIDAISTYDYSFFRNHFFDVCINCAGAASVADSWKWPLRDFELNVNLVAKLLEAIRQNNPTCKFINISSAAVYGSPTVLPIHESTPVNPISPYGAHKVKSEEICLEFSKYFDVKTCSIRIFSAFGPGLRKQIFWEWFLKSRKDQLLTLPGTGKETRDYIYISDLIKGISLMISNAQFEGETYNLGSGQQYQIDEVAEYFFGKLNWKGKIQFDGQVRAGDPLYWQADITKLRSWGFKPDVSLVNGIEKYITWAKSLSLD